MNDLTIKTPTIRVPGLLSDDALQEQLKQFKANAGSTPVPTSAVDMADRVQSQFFDAPIKNTLKLAAPLAGPLSPALSLAASASPDALIAGSGAKTVDPQQRALDVRSDILSSDGVSAISSFYLGGGLGVLAREGGVLGNLGTLSAEESAAAQQENIADAKAAEARARDVADTHRRLRDLTDDQAAAMGFPVAPGGLDPQTAKELKEAGENLDERRIAAAGEQVKTATENAPTQTWWLNAIRSFSKAQSEGFTSIGKGLAIGLNELPREMVGLKNPGRSDMRAWFDTVDATMNKLMPADASKREDFDTILSAGAGSMSSFLTSSVVGNLIGLPAKTATTIVGAATGSAQQYEDAEAHHAGALQRLGAFLFGGAVGATEAIPFNRALGRLEKASGGVVSRMLATTAASSIEEFTQELGQSFGQDLVAKLIYDAQREFDPKAYLRNAAAGGILGAMGGTAVSVLQRSGMVPQPNHVDGQPEADAAAQAQRDAEQTTFLQSVIVDRQAQFNQLLGAEALVEASPAVDTAAAAESVQPTDTNAEAAAKLAGEGAVDETIQTADATDVANTGVELSPEDLVVLATYEPSSEAATPQASGDLQTLLSDARARLAARAELTSRLVEAGRPVRLEMEGGRTALAGPDVSNPDGFRLTYFDENGPSNHVEHVSLAAAVDAGLREGFKPAPELLASTSSGRGGYKAEPQRAAGAAGQTNPNADNVSLRQIANNFTQLLGLTVRQGRFTIKGADVMGQYSTRSGVVRLRTASDLSSLVHEGGHSLQQNADGSLKSFIAGNQTALGTVARQLYGGDTANMSKTELTAEGFAEFFRVFTTNRVYARNNYPTLTTDFETLLDQNNPELRDGLQLIGDQYAAWLQLPSAQLVRNMIQTGKQTTGINAAIQEAREQGLSNWFKEWVNGIHTAAINRYNGLNALVSDILNQSETNGRVIDLKRANDPRVLIRLATNSGNRAMVQMTDGVMGHRSTVPQSAGLREILLQYHGLQADQQLNAIDEERQRDFAAYTVALRGIDEYDRLAQGIISRPPLAATLGDLTMTVNEMEAKYGDDFKNAAANLHDYSMALWQKSYDAGLLDEKTYEDGKKRGYYVPLQRDMSDKLDSQSGIKLQAVAQGRSIVKRFRGSDRDIIDPMDALMQKTFALEKVIAENEVKSALARLADQAGTVGALVERVPASKMLGQQYSVEEVARSLTKDPTMSAADAQDLMNLLEAAIDDGNRIALFRSQQALAGGENIIFFWEKGKLAALQLKDGSVGTDIINTLNAVGTESVPLLVDLIAYPSTVFRSAVTSWPDFLLVNFIRDQMSAFVLTEGYTPFVTGIKGVAEEIRQHQWAREYNAAMGTMGGMNSSTLHEARVNTDIAALRKKGYIAQVFREKGFAGAARGFGRLTELTETGTRLGIYRTTYDRAVKDGLTPWEASVEAAYVSTDYIDFGLHGNRMMAWRRLIPFLNAQLQGLNKMVRTLAGDEVRQRKGLMFAVTSFFKDTNSLPLSRAERDAVRIGRKAWLKMASLGIIGAALQAVFADDPDYQDASEYLRTTGWVIPIGNGQIFYIPKPFELAMVSNFVERGLESASGDKEAKNRLLRGMAMNLLPPTNPPAIQTVVEQLANHSFFGEREIVPDYMLALEPELQYNHYTSEFAKQVGQIFGWSPMRIDHVMSSLGASAYRDLTSVYNMTDSSRPQSDVTDWPMTRRFVRDARRGSTSAQDFWKFASTTTGSLRRAETTYRNYIEAGRERAASNYLDELDGDEKAYAILNAHFKADYKKLNPTYRVRQLTTIISAMRRELYSDLGVENSMKGMETEPFMLSAKEKADVDELFSELARREVRNTLIYSKAPGWSGKKPLDTETTLDIMRATMPSIAEEYERRVKKAKVYSAETVQDYWPEVRDRLIQDRDQAFLKDILAVAKAMR
jgi:hypothetical protein